MDLANMGAKHVGVYTDRNLAKLPPMKATLEALKKANVNFTVYDEVRGNNNKINNLTGMAMGLTLVFYTIV